MLTLTLLLACQQNFGDGKTRQGGAEEEPEDNFGGRMAVRITSPAAGDTVTAPFTLEWEAGEDIAQLEVYLDSHPALGPFDATTSGSVEIEAEEGRYPIELYGIDADGTYVTSHEVWVRVSAEDASWVTITSPTDGDEVHNPVTFAVSASADVDEVELLADGWSIGTLAPGATLTYEFSGTGYAREVQAVAHADEEVVATDTIEITVEPEETANSSSFNEVVLDILESYPRDGSHDYYWPDDEDWYGTTRDIYYLDELVAEGDSQGRCYCVGLTWEVYLRAFDEVDRETGGDGSLNGLSVDDLSDFRVDWFVRDLWGDGVGVAMDNYGLGDEITDVADLEPGDFVQFWRFSGSGHSVIFIDHIVEDGEIVGIEYWSTQSSTDGIDYNAEYFGASGSRIDPNYFYAARARMPEDWEAWR